MALKLAKRANKNKSIFFLYLIWKSKFNSEFESVEASAKKFTQKMYMLKLLLTRIYGGIFYHFA